MKILSNLYKIKNCECNLIATIEKESEREREIHWRFWRVLLFFINNRPRGYHELIRKNILK